MNSKNRLYAFDCIVFSKGRLQRRRSASNEGAMMAADGGGSHDDDKDSRYKGKGNMYLCISSQPFIF